MEGMMDEYRQSNYYQYIHQLFSQLTDTSAKSNEKEILFVMSVQGKMSSFCYLKPPGQNYHNQANYMYIHKF